MLRCLSTVSVGFASILALPLYYTFFPAKVYNIEGACAVVTGASDGIGVYIAHTLAARGVSRLAIGARRLEKLERVKEDITRLHPQTRVLPVRLDVSNNESRREFVRAIETTLGPCEILVNNAAIESGSFFEKVTDDQVESMININLVGLIHLTRAVVPSMLKAGRGHIVNIASLAGKFGTPFQTIYSATKFGLTGFTYALRAEMQYEGKPVTAHVVSPGFVRDAGMAANGAARSGLSLESATDIFGYSYPQDSADAVVQAIEYNEPDLIVNFPRVRPLVGVLAFFPRFADLQIRLTKQFGVDGAFKFFRAGAVENSR